MTKERLMVRNLSVIVLFLCFAAAANAQMKTLSDVGIDEKLGSQAALDTVLKDENGSDVTLRQYVDKPTILIFNYLRCPGICPVLINSMVDTINRMPIEPGKAFRLVAVSFDPADTPDLAREKKANYLNQMKRSFSPDDWHFLTGSAENTRAVADSVGFNYRREGDMYVHPGAIILLTPKGIVSRYLYGARFVPAEVQMAVQEAAGGQVLPSISKVLSFCYVSDPQGRGRVFSVTRFAGAATLLIAGVFVFFVLRGKSRRKEKELHK